MFELEYWNPCENTVIDSMHSLDLNLLKNHCRNLFQIDLSRDAGSAERSGLLSDATVKRVTSNRLDLRALEKCQEIIFQNEVNMLDSLLQTARKILYTFCLDYEIKGADHSLVVGTRYVLARNITIWRQSDSPLRKAFLDRYPQLSVEQTRLIGGDEGAPSLAAEPPGAAGIAEGVLEIDQTAEPEVLGMVVEDQDREASGITADDKSKMPGLVRKLLSASPPNSLYARFNVRMLAKILDDLDVDRSDIPTSARSLKKVLYDLLLASLSEKEGCDQDLLALYPEAEDVSSGSASAFLGQDTMHEIWADMARTRLPSWVTPAPKDWGTVRRGHLSADNWKVICCIHLPITLIWLHGSSTDRKRDLLENFMHLISAVRIASLRSISLDHIERYNSLIFRYTQGTRELYPDYSLLPSHHAALHIGDMLWMFGPKHAHDSPHYERYIYFFHQMNTNNKQGDIEGTYLQTACRYSNLTALLEEDPSAAELAIDLLARLKIVNDERIRGFRLTEVYQRKVEEAEAMVIDPVGAQVLSPEQHVLLCGVLQAAPSERNTVVSASVIELEGVAHQGTTYHPWDSPRYRDSAIAFHHLYDRDDLRAGRIEKIFRHAHTRSDGAHLTTNYLLVRAYRPRPSEEDAYRKFGFAAGFSALLDDMQMIVVPVSQILSHIALTEFPEFGLVHALPISHDSLSLDGDVEQEELFQNDEANADREHDA
ncbi:hypothetical protein BKA70DRAFT_1428553 [Coprinopsis sp. MPI-PUGE-AT-0042]|nr:hypothetical protein BKA70DRAFT_1428553 [Coprinopsis sp. MPI-PUGE-AT-0042]